MCGVLRFFFFVVDGFCLMFRSASEYISNGSGAAGSGDNFSAPRSASDVQEHLRILRKCVDHGTLLQVLQGNSSAASRDFCSHFCCRFSSTSAKRWQSRSGWSTDAPAEEESVCNCGVSQRSGRRIGTCGSHCCCIFFFVHTRATTSTASSSSMRFMPEARGTDWF
jgi:hypothetical protein